MLAALLLLATQAPGPIAEPVEGGSEGPPDHFRAYLRDADARTRLSECLTIPADLDRARVASDLIAALADADALISVSAAMSLGDYGDVPGVPEALVDALIDARFEVRAQCLLALIKAGPSAHPALRSALQDETPLGSEPGGPRSWGRRGDLAAVALWQSEAGLSWESALELCRIHGSGSRVSNRAHLALDLSPDAARRSLGRALRSGSPEAVRLAIHGLYLLPTSELVPFLPLLAASLLDAPGNRVTALSDLVQRLDEQDESLDALIAATRAWSPWTRSECLEFLIYHTERYRFEQGGPSKADWDRVRAALVAGLGDRSARVRKAAILGLYRLHEEDQLSRTELGKLAEPLLLDARTSVRVHAARAVRVAAVSDPAAAARIEQLAWGDSEPVAAAIAPWLPSWLIGEDEVGRRSWRSLSAQLSAGPHRRRAADILLTLQCRHSDPRWVAYSEPSPEAAARLADVELLSLAMDALGAPATLRRISDLDRPTESLRAAAVPVLRSLAIGDAPERAARAIELLDRWEEPLRPGELRVLAEHLREGPRRGLPELSKVLLRGRNLPSEAMELLAARIAREPETIAHLAAPLGALAPADADLGPTLLPALDAVLALGERARPPAARDLVPIPELFLARPYRPGKGSVLAEEVIAAGRVLVARGRNARAWWDRAERVLRGEGLELSGTQREDLRRLRDRVDHAPDAWRQILEAERGLSLEDSVRRLDERAEENPAYRDLLVELLGHPDAEIRDTVGRRFVWPRSMPPEAVRAARALAADPSSPACADAFRLLTDVGLADAEDFRKRLVASSPFDRATALYALAETGTTFGSGGGRAGDDVAETLERLRRELEPLVVQLLSDPSLAAGALDVLEKQDALTRESLDACEALLHSPAFPERVHLLWLLEDAGRDPTADELLAWCAAPQGALRWACGWRWLRHAAEDALDPSALFVVTQRSAEEYAREVIRRGLKVIVPPESVFMSGSSTIEWFPRLPWPPPMMCRSQRLDELALGSEEPPTLGDVQGLLERALRESSRGFSSSIFLGPPDGFALMTRLERIEDDGTPYAGKDRWTQNKLRPRSFREYLASLFLERPGLFRQFVFAVTTDTAVSGSSEAELPTVQRGRADLPKKLRERALDEERCLVFVYCYRRAEGGKVVADCTAVSASALVHLERAGLLRTLVPPK